MKFIKKGGEFVSSPDCVQFQLKLLAFIDEEMKERKLSIADVVATLEFVKYLLFRYNEEEVNAFD